MKKYDRHSIRLKGYDYSCKGLYFVTVCVQDRKQLLGNIMEGIMEINDIGELVQQEWLSIEQRFPVVCMNTRLCLIIFMPLSNS